MEKNNMFIKIKLIISILIVSLMMSLGIYSIAAEMGFQANDELISIDTQNVGAASSGAYRNIATYSPQYTYVGSKDDFKNRLNEKPFTALEKNHSIYCKQHGGRLFDNPHGELVRQHESNVNMNSAVKFDEFGGAYSWSDGSSVKKWLDYKNADETPSPYPGGAQKNADTHIRYKVSDYTLSTIEAYAVSFNGMDHGGSHGQGESCPGPYRNFPSQQAIWQMENDLYKAANAVNALGGEISSHGENPEVSPLRQNGTTGSGTVLEGDYYKIGPFSMSDYAYVAYSGVSKYSGKGLKYPDLVGGISDGWITLDNGITINFEDIEIVYISTGDNNRSGSLAYRNVIDDDNSSMGTTKANAWTAPSNFKCPWPKSTFYIRIKRSSCGSATTLNSFTFKYRKTQSSGSGYYAEGEYIRPTFTIVDVETGCNTYYSSTAACGERHSRTGPGTVTWDHTYKDGCGNACTGDCGGTEEEPEDCGTCCSGHNCSGSETGKCNHDHTDCKKFNWKGTLQKLPAQPLLAVIKATTIVKEKEVTSTVNLRLTTDLTIDKYIVKVEHVGESFSIYDNKTERSREKNARNTKTWKDSNPVPAEKGDKVTYYIDIINKQNQKVSCRIEDIYPSKSDTRTLKLQKDGSNVTKNTWIVVDGNSYTRIIATLRVTADTGKWENSVKIITNNSGNPAYNRTEYLGPTANPSLTGPDARHHGPVVNVAEIQNRPQEDSDFYVVKEYNVSIEKYIYDVTHNQSNINVARNLDTTLNATDDRSRTNTSITEDVKRTNPVYVEYGDTITYKIIVYNTPNNYAPFNVNRGGAPYYNPDKVYVNLKDTLPKKYSNLNITVEGSSITGNDSHVISSTAQSSNGGTFTITDLMIPAGGRRVITVTLKVEEYEKGTIEQNNVMFNPANIRNINRGPGKGTNSRSPNKYCVIKNNSRNLTTSDWYILNNYNTFTDKYVYKYYEEMQIQNNGNDGTSEKYLDSGYVSDENGILKQSRRNTNATTTNVTDRNNMTDIVRVPDTQETYKKQHPVSVEKTERMVYRIAITNDAETITTGKIASGKKPATQIRTSTVTDYLEDGLLFEKVTAAIYSDEAGTKKVVDNVPVKSKLIRTEKIGDRDFNVYEFTVGNETIVNPNETIIYEVEVKVLQSNMYLKDLQNKAVLTRLTNINNTDTETRDVKNNTYNEDISPQDTTGSSEFVRMKDLVIGGYVWLDFNKDGLKNDKSNDSSKAYYNLNDNAMKRDIVVKLYQVNKENSTLIRTTKTDANGFYTFGKGSDNAFAWRSADYNYATEVKDKEGKTTSKAYSSGNNLKLDYYQRVEKATNKDDYGNYTDKSELIKYYIEFEYDGVVFKSTEFYSGMDNLNIDKTSPDYGKVMNKYAKEGDSNALEFTDVRENFNKKYEYITYDKAYPINTTNDGVEKAEDKSANLNFDKTTHTSQLIEDPSRTITARTFINANTIKGQYDLDHNKWNPARCDSSIANTNTLWLFPFDGSTDNETPDTEYLKNINLGLELREDIDIALTKDVYSVKTLINGEEMEYFYNKNNALNGEVGKSSGQFINDYIVAQPYGLDLYESDYKMRVEQYSSDTVKAYKGLQGESELNVEVTYRITVANKPINDDETLDSSVTKDTKLKVKISEIVDFYDQNFKKYNSPTDVVNVKTKDENGYLKNDTLKVAEAWYFEENKDGDYIIDENDKLPSTYSKKASTSAKEKPVFIKVDSVDSETAKSAKRYSKHYLTLSNTSMLGDGNSNKENSNNFIADGYNTLYISGMEADQSLDISEGRDIDIYVKYVVDKDKLSIENTNEDYEETVTETKNDKGEVVKKTVTDITSLERSLKIAEKVVKDAKTSRGLEGIAQVNVYSVWYDEYDKDGKPIQKPASLVDMDSNAGNIGNTNTELVNKLKDVVDTNTRNGIISESKKAKKDKYTSADNWDLYEDITYKTGIEITADGTEWTKVQAEEKYPGKIVIQKDKMLRELSGMVWDDSRTEPQDNGRNDVQYSANGIYNTEDKKNPKALDNQNVKTSYDNESATPKTKDAEETYDLKVRNARAELVEIVEIPPTEPNGETRYYEEVLHDVTWKQAQHMRTLANGSYKITGFIPGKYTVKFTYGDTIDNLTKAEIRYASGKSDTDEITAEDISKNIENAATDMRIFNGQDYKTTKYAYNISDYTTKAKDLAEIPVNEGTIDQYAAGLGKTTISNNDIVMAALERPDLSDARDDEIKRLEVNNYSEIMVNEKAEILKGLASSTGLSTKSLPADNEEKVDYYKHFSTYQTDKEKYLRTLTDNTNMNAETVEFLVKPEKLTYEQTQKNSYYQKMNNGKDYYYNDLDTLVTEYITQRAYKIQNIDMGIEYRPETNISLSKEIHDIQLITSNNEILVDLKVRTKMEKGLPVHYIDIDNSIGAELVQFISNTYAIDPLLKNVIDKDVYEEKQQGTIYIAVDEEILQGSKIIVQYKFTAQNNSEIDTISKNLNNIRFYGNETTQELLKNGYTNEDALNKITTLDTNGKEIAGQEYTANNFARNIVYKNVYRTDTDGSVYRNRAKTMTQDDINNTRKFANGANGYYGNYVGYTYYTGKDDKNLDVISELKFDKIMDYIDTNLEYGQLSQVDITTLGTIGDDLNREDFSTDLSAVINQNWTNTSELPATNLARYLFSLNSPWGSLRAALADKNDSKLEDDPASPVTNPIKIAGDLAANMLTDLNGIEYQSLVMTVSDATKDIDIADENNITRNKQFSRFLLPSIVTELKVNEAKENNTKYDDESIATVYLPVSKVLSSEEDTDNMMYENIAEVIQFTVLTGRRTNFETTIGNANIHEVDKQFKDRNENYDKYGSVEFVTSSLETDTSASETITLAPPTGLMMSRAKVYETMETTRNALGIIIIVVAVVVIVIVGTKFTMYKIKKKRYK